MAATYEQMQAMHTLLEADNARECVDALLNQYAKESYNNAQYLYIRLVLGEGAGQWMISNSPSWATEKQPSG